MGTGRPDRYRPSPSRPAYHGKRHPPRLRPNRQLPVQLSAGRAARPALGPVAGRRHRSHRATQDSNFERRSPALLLATCRAGTMPELRVGTAPATSVPTVPAAACLHSPRSRGPGTLRPGERVPRSDKARSRCRPAQTHAGQSPVSTGTCPRTRSSPDPCIRRLGSRASCRNTAGICERAVSAPPEARWRGPALHRQQDQGPGSRRPPRHALS